MADMMKLKRFHVEEDGEGFRLEVEGEGGDVLSLAATREQVDLIADTLDELLSESDEEDEVEAEAT